MSMAKKDKVKTTGQSQLTGIIWLVGESNFFMVNLYLAGLAVKAGIWRLTRGEHFFNGFCVVIHIADNQIKMNIGQKFGHGFGKISKANIAAVNDFLNFVFLGPGGKFFKSRVVAVGVGDNRDEHDLILAFFTKKLNQVEFKNFV